MFFVQKVLCVQNVSSHFSSSFERRNWDCNITLIIQSVQNTPQVFFSKIIILDFQYFGLGYIVT